MIPYNYRVTQKNARIFLLYEKCSNSRTKLRNYKPIFSPENWDSYTNFEYRTFSVLFNGAEIFVEQNGVSRKSHSDKLKLSYFELPRILKDNWKENWFKSSWSVWATLGLLGHSGAIRIIKGLSWASWGILRPIWDWKCYCGPGWIRFFSRTLFCSASISAPINGLEKVLYSYFAYGSQFSREKKRVVIPILCSGVTAFLVK